ncbi:MAG: hypothetical protein J6B85_06520 [Lachnospiraceae bacterium]|nr:hypothetical protein [Lachnospiraceae bacterium]
MRRIQTQGISCREIDTSATFRSGRPTGENVIRLLFAICGMYGALFLPLQSIELTVPDTRLQVMIVGSALLHFVIYRFWKPFWFLLPVSIVAMGVLLVTNADYLSAGILKLCNSYVDGYRQYTEINMAYFTSELLPAQPDEARSLLLTLAPVIYLLGYGYVSAFFGYGQKVFTYLLTGLLFSVGLSIGVVPPIVPLLCCLCSILALLILKRKSVSAAAGAAAVGVFLLLYALCSRLMPEEKYPEQKVIEKKQELIRKAEESAMSLSLWWEYGPFAETARKLENTGLFEWLGSGKAASGGLSGGRLGRVEGVQYRYEPAFTFSVSGTLNEFYLKGYVGNHYESDRWGGLTQEEAERLARFEQEWEEAGEPFDVRNQSAVLLELTGDPYSRQEGTVTIQNANPYFYYLPYTADSRSLGYDPDEFLYTKPVKRREEYTFAYYSPVPEPEGLMSYPTAWKRLGGDDLDAFLRAEEAYYELVLELYAKEPEELVITPELGEILVELEKASSVYEGISPDVEESSLDISEEKAEGTLWEAAQDSELYRSRLAYEEVLAKVSAVQTYLAENLEYTLMPGSLPEGKDFVTWFLTENKQGYCSHFAASGAVLLKLLGVPARYVEGYYVSTDQMLQAFVEQLKEGESYGKVSREDITAVDVEVTDESAHAWVEVYIRGYGWTPVEMTPPGSAPGQIDVSGDTFKSVEVMPNEDGTVTVRYELKSGAVYQKTTSVEWSESGEAAANPQVTSEPGSASSSQEKEQGISNPQNTTNAEETESENPEGSTDSENTQEDTTDSESPEGSLTAGETQNGGIEEEGGNSQREPLPDNGPQGGAAGGTERSLPEWMKALLSGEAAGKLGKILLWAGAVLVLFAIGYLALSVAARGNRKRVEARIASEDRNAAVLFLYERCLKIISELGITSVGPEDEPEYAQRLDEQLAACGSPEPARMSVSAKEFMDIALRARYSGRRISEEEHRKAIVFYEEWKSVYLQNASGLRRFCARIFGPF